MSSFVPNLSENASFQQNLRHHQHPALLLKQALREGDAAIRKQFDAGHPINQLVIERAALIDQLLAQAWTLLLPERSKRVALVAVGGYGRGELHPYSDIDLLILLRGGDSTAQQLEHVSGFIRLLWDLGLEIGHSVRTLAECEQEAAAELTVVTNLLESRFLCGHRPLFDAMRRAITADRMWPSERFFQAKVEEQRKRHSRGDLASNLEPNLKECPGGLRDIQTIGWVLKRHFGGERLRDLVVRGFLNEAEYRALIDGQELLWRIRFVLHSIAKRHEDRLLFDHQRTLANWFGYSDDHHSLAVEKFMQLFYRNTAQLRMLNERILQLFDEVILRGDQLQQVQPLNRRFRARNGYIEVVDDQVFQRHPFALLEIFLLLQQHPELKGIRAATIRRIGFDRELVDHHFRNDLRTRALFMEILRQPKGVDRVLRRMSRYGILGRYIPAFGRIIGRMQFDLFHMYTVDEHTLNLLRNLQRFTRRRYATEFPLCSRTMQLIPKRELLFLAGLFHDIAKGRGGDHSTLGAEEARLFCYRHQLSAQDGDLVAWLVQNHLVMSMVAQRQDIQDPEVIRAFAERVVTLARLDYLYLLTVADVRATDPNKWNSWKDSLLRQLYLATRDALRRGLENTQQVDELVAEQQQQALTQVADVGIEREQAEGLWEGLNRDYFLQYSPAGLAWHLCQFRDARSATTPLVRVRQETVKGGSEVLIIARNNSSPLFAAATCTLDQLQLNVQSAHIETTSTGFTLDSFKVLEEDGEAIRDPQRVAEVVAAMEQGLIQNRHFRPCLHKRVSRQRKFFDITTHIDYCRDPAGQRTILKLTMADRPGLLAIIGDIFCHCGILLHRAKIATIGAKAEDTFFITDEQGQQLSRREQFDCLQREIFRRIDNGGE